MFEWDVFLSHASEDESIALELARELTRFGLRVWLDTSNLKLGDSIRSNIDRGLVKSAYGVLLITSTFLQKLWPAQEVSALFALEFDGRPRILPVWHGVELADVAAVSPLLADRLPAKTSDGLSQVARMITLRVLDPTVAAPAVDIPTVATRLRNLLEKDPEADTLCDFLDAHRWVITGALAVAYGEVYPGDSFVVTAWKPPFIHVAHQPTAGNTYLTLIGFGAVDEVQESPSQLTTEVREKMRDTILSLNGLRAHAYLVETMFGQAGRLLTPAKWRIGRVTGAIFRGRRAVMTEMRNNYWSEKHLQVTERSYDALVDAASIELQPWHVDGLVALGETKPGAETDA